MKTSSIKNSLKTVVPCVTYGTFCGALTGAVVFCFKLAAKYLEEISRFVYSLPSKNSLFILAIFAGLVILALSEFLLHKKLPEVRGGGIPRTEGILRGMLSFKGLRTLVGTAFGSFVSFFAGLPLGSEGPAVLIGTSVGGLCIGKRSSHSAWQRYVMSGGAGAGFAVATGAPISGMLFVVEEVHKKFAPTLILIVSVSVISATCINKLLCSLFGISDSLFDFGNLIEFDIKYVGYLAFASLLIALGVGVFDASINRFSNLFKKFKKFNKLPIKLVVLFIVVGVFGIVYPSAIYSGHHVIDSVVGGKFSVAPLVLILFLRMALLLLSTDSGATGGIYIPTLCIGVVFSAIMSYLMMIIGMPAEYIPLMSVIGMCAFLGGTLRSPFVALVFFIEITEGLGNVFFAAVAIFIVNIITTFFSKKPFYDRVLEGMEHSENDKEDLVVEYFELRVSADSFVVGKSVRDIMWPHATVIVSINRDNKDFSDTDLDGEKQLRVGDTLVIRARTYDVEELKKYLYSLVGREYQISVS
ncbi:MAG: chloride channel protein [Clostridia bacterium]|nr:chloride channel protein [Clostridia bacterium]MBO5315528.1 chloride channel protein [Clostridia bacterium]